MISMLFLTKYTSLVMSDLSIESTTKHDHKVISSAVRLRQNGNGPFLGAGKMVYNRPCEDASYTAGQAVSQAVSVLL